MKTKEPGTTERQENEQRLCNGDSEVEHNEKQELVSDDFLAQFKSYEDYRKWSDKQQEEIRTEEQSSSSAEQELPAPGDVAQKRPKPVQAEAEECLAPTGPENGTVSTDKATQGDAKLPDFVDTYVRYADIYEMPAEVHEAMALGLLAAAANGNVDIELRAIRLSLDCWFLITTGSGGGRNTAIRTARAILRAAGLDALVQNISWGSEVIVKQYFAENPRGLFMWPEMSEKLLDLGRPQFAGVKPWITDLYDETTPPPSKIYRKIPRKKGTPDIKFDVAPRTTFIATSSFAWLMQNLTRVDSTGGFLARWMHMHSSKKDRLIPIPEHSDKKLIPSLAKRLGQVAKLEGTADFTAVEKMYVEWYEKTAKRFAEQPNQDIAQAYWNRHRDHLLKLAVLFEMSESGMLKVTPGAMKRAMIYAARIERSLFSVLTTGFEREGYELERMIQYVRSKGVDGVSTSVFTSEFKNVDASLRAKRVSTLLQSGDLRRFERRTPGRSANIVVHADFVEEHKRKYTEDTELL